MPYFVLVNGELIEVDRRTFDTVKRDGNRSFELTENNPNPEFANTYHELVTDFEWDEDEEFEVVEMEDGYDEK